MKNVQEVIDELNKVEDKTLPVFFHTNCMCGVYEISKISVEEPKLKNFKKGVYLKN